MAKIFALIHKESSHIHPQEKIIPQKSFSCLLEAQELIEEVKKDCLNYKQEALDSCEKVKNEAQEKGFDKGLANWSDQIAYLEKSIQDANNAAEKLIVSVALEAAKKIVKKEISLNHDTIVDIVKGSLKSVSSHRKIILHVNPKDYEALNSKKKLLEENFEKLESLSINAKDNIEPGGCVIETEQGIINAQWSKQWEALELAFNKLLTQDE
jgi:type III secretion protein L